MKHILAISLTLLSSQVFACKDSLSPQPDKIKHFAVEAALGTISGSIIEDKYLASAVALVPGVAKEIYDLKNPQSHCASYYDLAWDLAGVITGVNLGHWGIQKTSQTFLVTYKVELK